MMTRSTLTAAALAVGLFAAAPASALGLKDCSDKYSAAKAAGTLGAKTWAEFRKSECAKDATPAAATAPAPAPSAAAKPAPAPAAAAPAAKAAVNLGNAVFPAKIDAKYTSFKAGKGREKTCLDQYRTNKSSGGNGGLKWIQKGGGYYSECNKRLKS